MTSFVPIFAASLVNGAFWFWAGRGKADPRQDTQDTLTRLKLDVAPEVCAYLDAHMARRKLWGRIGGALGGMAAFPTAQLVSQSIEDFWAIIATLVGFLGCAVGTALSAQFSPSPPIDQPRLAAVRPYGLRSYLAMREIAFELLLTGAGTAAIASGLWMVLFLPDAHDGSHWIAPGVLVGGTAGCALVLQRRLARLPRRAGSPAQVMANDIVRAVAIRDLMVPVAGMASIGAAVVANRFDAGFGWSILACYAGVGIGRLVLRPLQRGSAPVAQQIARKGAFV